MGMANTKRAQMRRGPRAAVLLDSRAFRGRIQMAMASRGIELQKDLARRARVGEGQLSRYLDKNTDGISADIVLRLAMGLDVSVGWLLAGDGTLSDRFRHEPDRQVASDPVEQTPAPGSSVRPR